MSEIRYHKTTRQFNGGIFSTVHRVDIPAGRLRFEDLHPMSSYVRQQDIARMHYARARARGEDRPHILTWTAMQTDRRAEQMFPGLSYRTDDGEQIISANSFITCVLRKLLAEGWLQLHEYIGDTYEWQVDIPAAQRDWRARAASVLSWLEESIQLDLYPNIERGSYQPRVFRPFDVRHNFIRIGRCDFIRRFVQNHERQVVFNTTHFLHEHDDLISHHSGYGDAIGLMVAENTILRPPIYRRGALLYDGAAWRIETFSLNEIQLVLPGDITLSAIADCVQRFHLNPPDPQPITIYTRAGGLADDSRPHDRSPAAPDRMEFVLVNRQVLSWKRGGGLQIPQNGFVLSLQDGALPARVAEDLIENAWVEYEFADENSRLQSAIQAGPILMRQGENVLEQSAAAEEFYPSRGAAVGVSPVHIDLGGESQRKARSALGIKPDGNLLLVVVDGCNPSFRTEMDSHGATLDEMIGILQEAGAVDALNLSGEGSSHLFVAGGLASLPSDRRGQRGVIYERMLPSIGIVD
ncbi:MAG: phosphodiester glycosidase family protein [Chloroflexi bacterium]|nr:phosphodiester glycosidase family protein [Chloroflexota bacterium]